ncbi:tyrosine-type recombinase/integrase [Streptosporangium sp. NPDC002524]|uniref:tyrosine-type recombinase/integrase n=1 Tax=Streptosporangium sp. NPDC002524 TaxID=3154537 RepID=UPI0033261492
MTDTLPELVPAGGELLPAGPGYDYDPATDPYRVYLDSLDSAESRRTMRGCLDRLARILCDRPTTDKTITGAGFHWHRLRYTHTVRLRVLLQEQKTKKGEPWSTNYVNKHLVAMRKVLEHAWQLEQMTAEDKERAQKVPEVKGTRLPVGQHVPIETIGLILDACDADTKKPATTLAGLRDGALIATLVSTGVRRAEAADVTMADYNPRTKTLRVIGKGNKQREVNLAPYAVIRMEKWLARRGRGPGALFPRFNRGSRANGPKIRMREGRAVHVQPQGIADILDARLTQAGVDASINPHDLRRTFVGELLDAGVDLATAQELAGHASPATTALYDLRDGRRRAAAVALLPEPPAAPTGDAAP